MRHRLRKSLAFLSVLAVGMLSSVVLGQPVAAAGTSSAANDRFDCADPNTGVGEVYQVVWYTDPSDAGSGATVNEVTTSWRSGTAISSATAANELRPFQMLKYDTTTGTYTALQSYRIAGQVFPKLGGGNVSFPAGKKYEANSLLMSPDGTAYATLTAVDGSGAYLVRLENSSYSSGWGKVTVITELQSTEVTSQPTKINAGAYAEIGGVPHALVSLRFGELRNRNSFKINLQTGVATTWLHHQTSSNIVSESADFVWLADPIDWNGANYDVVGIFAKNAGLGVQFMQSTGTQWATTTVPWPSNSFRDLYFGNQPDVFGGAYSYDHPLDSSEPIRLYFSHNSGRFLELGLKNTSKLANGDPTGFELIKLKDSQLTNRNDGASCYSEIPPTMDPSMVDLGTLTLSCVDGVGTATVQVHNISEGGTSATGLITGKLNGTLIPAGWSNNSTVVGSAMNSHSLAFSGAAATRNITFDISYGDVINISLAGLSPTTVLPPTSITVTADESRGCQPEPPAPNFAPTGTVSAVCNAGNNGWNISVDVDNSASDVQINYSVYRTPTTTQVATGTVAAGADPAASVVTVADSVLSPGDTLQLVMWQTTDQAMMVNGGTAVLPPCRNEPAPPPPPLLCETWAGLISTAVPSGSSTVFFRTIDTTTGDYTTPETWQYTGFSSINATAVGPDNYMYGYVRVNAGDRGSLARLYPSGGVHYLAEAPQTGLITGAIDSSGRYYTIAGGLLYRTVDPITSLDGYFAEADADQEAYDSFGDPTWESFGSSGALAGSDVAVYNASNLTVVTAAHSSPTALTTTVYWMIIDESNGAVSTGSTQVDTALGTVTNGTYGSAFVDGSSVYFTPNNGFDTLTGEGRSTIRLDLSDLNDIQATTLNWPVGSSRNNDGSNMLSCEQQFPDEFGAIHGYMWADFNRDGLRPTVTPTAGLFGGVEDAIPGYTAYITSTSPWKTASGKITVPAGTIYAVSVDANGRWSASNLPSVSGDGVTPITYKLHVDTSSAIYPAGWVPSGFTSAHIGGAMNTNALEIDSDVYAISTSSESVSTSAVTLTSDTALTVVTNADTHRSDIGILVDPTWEPEASVSPECTTGTVAVTLDNSNANVDAMFSVYVYINSVDPANLVAAESTTQLVAAGNVATYGTAVTAPTNGDLLVIQVFADAAYNGVVAVGEYTLAAYNASGFDTVNIFCINIDVSQQCDAEGGLVKIDNTGSSEEGTYELILTIDGVAQAPLTGTAQTAAVTQVPLTIPEDSTWSLEWSVTSNSGGTAFSGVTPEWTNDCLAPVWEGTVDITTTCAANDTSNYTIEFDTSGSEVPSVYTVYVDGLAVETGTIAPGASYTAQGTVSDGSFLYAVVSENSDDPRVAGSASDSTLPDCLDAIAALSIEVDCLPDGTAEVSGLVSNTGDTSVTATLSALLPDSTSVPVASFTVEPGSITPLLLVRPTGATYVLSVSGPYGSVTSGEAEGGCLVPTPYEPTVLVQQSCEDGRIMVFADNTSSPYHSTFTVNVLRDGATIESFEVFVPAGEVLEVTNGTLLTTTAFQTEISWSTTGESTFGNTFTAEGASGSLQTQACPVPVSLEPSASVSLSCVAGVTSWIATVNNGASTGEVQYTIRIDGAMSAEGSVPSADSKSWSGQLSEGQTIEIQVLDGESVLASDSQTAEGCEVPQTPLPNTGSSLQSSLILSAVAVSSVAAGAYGIRRVFKQS